MLFLFNVKEAFNYRTELKAIKSKQEQLIKLKQSIESISGDQLNDDLSRLKVLYLGH